MALLNYYEIFGISRLASESEIKKAYRLLVRKYHPDVTNNNPKSTERFKQVQEAYEVLMDVSRRKDYDDMTSVPPKQPFHSPPPPPSRATSNMRPIPCRIRPTIIVAFALLFVVLGKIFGWFASVDDNYRGAVSPRVWSSLNQDNTQDNANNTKAEPDSANPNLIAMPQPTELVKDDSLEMIQLRKAAEAGNADATNKIGDLYNNGEGVDKDNIQAMSWYRKAADAGNADAMNSIGYLYYRGLGMEADYKQAMSWFHKAADTSNVYAMRNIGIVDEFGPLVSLERHPDQAMLWYRKAADAGDIAAMNNIGQLYEGNAMTGVKQDLTQAMSWFRKAADSGNTNAMANIGCLYEGYLLVKPFGEEKDYNQAMAWYQKAADAGNSLAMHRISDLYEHGWGVKQDSNQALLWLQKPANNQDGPMDLEHGTK